jgi:hypothetical protein
MQMIKITKHNCLLTLEKSGGILIPRFAAQKMLFVDLLGLLKEEHLLMPEQVKENL